MRYILFLLCIGSASLFGQYSNPDNGLLYIDDEVPRIDVFMSDDSLDVLLEDVFSNHEFPATFIFTSSQLVDTIENVGIRLRGNTSRTAGKKSVKISFNSFEAGRKFQGVEKLNLNGEHNDPSIVRSKLAWDLCNWNDIPAARANHVRFYVNNIYAGLYVNVEHVDEEFVQKRMTDGSGNLFKCLYPADLHYKGSDPDLYKEVIFDRRAYQLKTNTEQDDYSKLAEFIDVLNNASDEDFICALENIFDVDNYLKVIVIDILTSNWDGPIVNKNNFYLYYDPCDERFTYIPYDLDNTFGIDWFSVDWADTDIYNWSDYSGQYRPIFERIIAVDQYRDRYTYYFKNILDNHFNSDFLNTYLDDKRELIQEYRVDDTFAEVDYDWTYQNFLDSYSAALGDHVKYGMKDYIAERASTARNQLLENDIVPIIHSVEEVWDELDIQLLIDAVDDSEILEVVVHYKFEDSAWESELVDANQNGQWSFTYNAEAVGILDYYVTVSDSEGKIQRLPACDAEQVQMGYLEVPEIVINEFMASNENAFPDEYVEYNDWIEIYNPTNQVIPIYKYFLSDDPSFPNKWKMPNTILSPNKYMIIWADGNPSQGDRHANFKLKKGGEFIGLFDEKYNHFAPIDTITYGQQETDLSSARLPNGFGDFEITTNVTPGSDNDISTDIKESNFVEVNVFPNPTNGYLMIEGDSKEITALQIVDSKGRIVVEELEIGRVDLSSIANGIYFLLGKKMNLDFVHKIVLVK